MTEFGIARAATAQHPVLVLAGEIDLNTADVLQRAALQCLSDGARALTIDFGGVTFMDSAGLSALVVIHRATQEADASLHARRVPERVERILTFTSLTSLFAVEPAASREATSPLVDEPPAR